MASGQLGGEAGAGINLSSSMTVVKKKTNKTGSGGAVLAASAHSFLCLCSHSEN